MVWIRSTIRLNIIPAVRYLAAVIPTVTVAVKTWTTESNTKVNIHLARTTCATLVVIHNMFHNTWTDVNGSRRKVHIRHWERRAKEYWVYFVEISLYGCIKWVVWFHLG